MIKREILSAATVILLAGTYLHYASALEPGDDSQIQDARQGKLLSQKLVLLENLLRQSRARQAMPAHDVDQVDELLAGARASLRQAQGHMEAGEIGPGSEAADEALKKLAAVSALARGQQKSTLVQRSRYQEQLAGVEALAAMGTTDHKGRVEDLVAAAEGLAREDDYLAANRKLSEAFDLAASSVALSYDKKTLLYSLNFENPMDEYRYETQRYNGNLMLIEVMLERDAAAGTRTVIDKLLLEARFIHGEAEQLVQEGKVADAISMLESANEKFSRILGMLGAR